MKRKKHMFAAAFMRAVDPIVSPFRDILPDAHTSVYVAHHIVLVEAFMCDALKF